MLSVSPNPATAAVQIFFQSPGITELTLDVYHISGRRVYLHELENISAGQHCIQWNCCDPIGEPLLPGVYFVRLRGGELCSSGRLVIVR